MSTAKSESTWKFQVAKKYFHPFHVLSDEKFIDLVVEPKAEGLFAPFLWAESKKEITSIPKMFAQLLLTIKPIYDKGEKNLPKYLGAFDNEKIVFVEFYHLWDIINSNPFNWKEKPSNVSKSNENVVAKYLTPSIINEFKFVTDEKDLKRFIKDNFTYNGDTIKLQITKNNFLHVYNRWADDVRKTITVSNETLQENDLIDGDFYLADLLSQDNQSVKGKLRVRLQGTYFEAVETRKNRLFKEEIQFNDGGKAHSIFWNRYYRPPAEEYWDYMIERRELLVPQKAREQKGAYFTPKIWVQKSQEYLEAAFGENWQDEYFIWDCCCGTGNLLAGLTNPDNVWASTLDKPDIDVLNELIDGGYNLLHPHVFQFDFLNDEFIPQSKGGKIPDALYKIISHPEKQKKLIIYINPPYKEAPTTRTMMGTGENRPGVAVNKTYEKYFDKLGRASREVFAQFFMRICNELPECKLASFSTLKYISGLAFRVFRRHFRAESQGGFIVLANTFDNVNGHFPIGFLIWNFENKKQFKKVICNVFETNKALTAVQQDGTKTFYTYRNSQYINEWRTSFFKKGEDRIGYLRLSGLDMQNNKKNFFTSTPSANDIKTHLTADITKENLIEMCIYLTVRHIFEPNWRNNRDQFLYPNDGYKRNRRFQNDCLTFALFHEKNKIKSQDGINHWIPFTRKDVKGKDSFASTFMSDFLQTRGIVSGGACPALSKAATVVFEAGKALWTYYHETIKSDDNANVNASLYEIREYFKGRNNAGRMNTKATDEKFTELDKALKTSLSALAEQIQPKVYEYGFLLK